MKKIKISERLKIGSLITVLLIVSSTKGYGVVVTQNYTNSGIIYGDPDDYYDHIYSGIRVNSNGLKLENNGIIKTLSNENNGVGIRNQGNFSTEEISNNGVIEAYSTEMHSSTSPNGAGIINNQSGRIKKIINKGILFGYSLGEEYGGTGIANGSDGGGSAPTIETIENKGIIGGFSDLKEAAYALSRTGNGISNASYSNIAKIESINNNGIITGESINEKYTNPIEQGIGNGIMNKGNSFGDGSHINLVNNNGIINGKISENLTSGITLSGNGITNGQNATIETINNSGIISGAYTPKGLGSSSISSRNGISNDGFIGKIENNGIIKGRIYSIRGSFDSLSNNGILIGTRTTSQDYSNKMGMEIILNSDSTIKSINNGTGGEAILNDDSIKTVVNGTEIGTIAGSNTTITSGDSYVLASKLTNEGNNLIINGAGVDQGALVVDKNATLTGSIINGYNTAMYVNDGVKVSATDTIFNGGGIKNDVAVIRGNEGANEVILLGNSIINGSVDLGNGDDTLLLANTTQINGALNGGDNTIDGVDILGLGQNSTAKTSTNLNVLHNVSGFETINTNGNVTLFETITVKDAANINLESGNLTLRVDPTKKDVDGKVIGHALYENTGNLSSTGGNLVVGLNGLGVDTIVSMGGTTITPETNDSWWKDSDHIKTNSLVLDGKLSENGKDISITLKENIPLEPSIPTDKPTILPELGGDPIPPEVGPPVNPEPPVIDGVLYEKLNQVYKSIASSGEFGALANTTLLDNKTFNESLGGLLSILDQIYANTPYSYTLKSSRDSLKLFEDNMSYLTIKPNSKEWLVQGKAIYTGVKNDNDGSGKNYYGFDTGHRNYKTTTNTVGGIATFEYGLSDKTSAGFVFGGNNQDINFKGTSSIDGNSLYLGTFAKTEKNQFKFMTGLGYQYISNDVDRSVSNQYDSFKTDEKYDVNSLNAFIEGKYSMNIDNQIIMEPKIRLSYYYVDQDKIDEGYTPGQISIKAGKATSSTGDLEIGIDFKKELTVKKGKLNNIVSIGVINTIGTKEKSLHGNIIGKNNDGSTFDIQGVKLPTTSGKIAYNIEFEQPNGMIYSTGLNFEFAKDNNRNLNIHAGIGYKF